LQFADAFLVMLVMVDTYALNLFCLQMRLAMITAFVNESS
jgi:hypothetical protein